MESKADNVAFAEDDLLAFKGVRATRREPALQSPPAAGNVLGQRVDQSRYGAGEAEACSSCDYLGAW